MRPDLINLSIEASHAVQLGGAAFRAEQVAKGLAHPLRIHSILHSKRLNNSTHASYYQAWLELREEIEIIVLHGGFVNRPY